MLRYDVTVVPARRRAFTDTSFSVSDSTVALEELLTVQGKLQLKKHLVKQPLSNMEAQNLGKKQINKPCHRRCASSPGNFASMSKSSIDPSQATSAESVIAEDRNQFQSSSKNQNERIMSFSNISVEDRSDVETRPIDSMNMIPTFLQRLTDSTFSSYVTGVTATEQFPTDPEVDVSTDTNAIESEHQVSAPRSCHHYSASCPDTFSSNLYAVNVNESKSLVNSPAASFDTTSYDGVEMTKEFQQKIEIDKDQVFDVIINEKWSELELLCNECPENAAAENLMVLHGQESSCFPLHAACKQRPTVSVVDTLITAHPRGVSYKESLLQALPIHIACMYAASPGVVRALLAAYPDSVNARDQDGNLPIHYAALFSSAKVVSILIQANPETCRSKNMKEKLPLHLACSRLSVNPLLVNSLIAAHPEGVKSKDYQGSLPIHVACCHRVDLDLIEILLHAFPCSIFERDNKGRTPLMFAKSVLRLPGNHLVILALEGAERSTGGGNFWIKEMIRSHRTSFIKKLRKKYRQDELIKAGYITTYQK